MSPAKRRGPRLDAREARLQAALTALREALGDVGSAWMSRLQARHRPGVSSLAMRLEPVWEPLTVETVTTALAKRDIVPRAARPHPTFAIRAQHVPSAVKLDLELAETLSPDLKRQLDETLGAGWASRRPAPARLRRAPKRERRSPQKRMPNTPRRA